MPLVLAAVERNTRIVTVKDYKPQEAVPKIGFPSFANRVKQSIMTLKQWIASGCAFAKNCVRMQIFSP
jgi:hypothetical protein